jgi:hypothetical protein
MNRWMQHDLVELVETDKAMTSHGLVVRHNAGERAPELGGEDNMDDVFCPPAALRRDRFDDRDRAFEWKLLSPLPDSRLLAELSMECLNQGLSALNATSGQQPVLLPALLVAAEQDRVVPPEQGRHSDSRLRPHVRPPTSPDRARHARWEEALRPLRQ